MRCLLPLVFVWTLSCTTSWCALALPEWSAEERARLEKGDIIPGAALLVETEEPNLLPKPKTQLEEKLPELPEPGPTYDPRTIPPEHLVQYFHGYPESHVVDPQRLLTMQETQDREGFLKYHAEDSEIDIKLYLFDAQQVIVAPYSMSMLLKEYFADGPLTAVVFYFVGDPSRTEFALGGKGAEGVTKSEQLRILDSARIKSLEISDTSAQLEALIVQFSIRLYWLEKSVMKIELASNPSETTTVESSKKDARSAKASFSTDRAGAMYLVAVVGGLIISFSALVMAWFMWNKYRKYHFPVIEPPRRLGADYGAGVGAVLGFRDSFGSPASQRDQVPDYLLRQ